MHCARCQCQAQFCNALGTSESDATMAAWPPQFCVYRYPLGKSGRPLSARSCVCMAQMFLCISCAPGLACSGSVLSQ